MRKLILLSLICCITSGKALAQKYEKLNFTLVKKITEETDPSRRVGLFVQGDITEIKRLTTLYNGYFKYSAGDIAAIELPVSKVMDLASSPKVLAAEDSYQQLQPLNDSLVSKANVLPIHLGLPPLPQPYKGNGVVIGIIDSGIDFNHPDFKDANSNTRLISIWDHNLPGAPPAGYTYGTEFTALQINNGQANAHVDNSNGHGTHVTGVAAGNGRAINYFQGVAPEADLVTVCLNWNLNTNAWLNSVADAVNYIFQKADAVNKPCVINISAGSYYGSHDALDLQAQMINNLITSKPGRAVVCAAGNAGNIRLHMQYNSTAGNDTLFTWYNYNPSYGTAILMEMWGSQGQFENVHFSVGADKTSGYYEHRGQRPFTSVLNHVGVFKMDTLYSWDGNRLARIQSQASLSAGRYSMIFNVIPDSNSYKFRLSFTGAGKFDVWSFQMESSNVPLPSVYPPSANYNMPDFTQNVVSSFACSDKVITVAEYGNKQSYIDCNGNQESLMVITPDSLAAASSKGPTRTGLLKPDISAPGGITMAPLVTYQISSIPPEKIAQGCMHMRDGGTSTASPAVAGVAALFFQRFPNATWQDVKNAILNCARLDSFTGSAGLPNIHWGYGKLDGFNALVNCPPLGIHENSLSNQTILLSAFPNPFEDQINFRFATLPGVQQMKLEIFDVNGRLISSLPIPPEASGLSLKKEFLGKGLFQARIISSGYLSNSVKIFSH
ncbi:MAG: S8 family serine peptidase [Bacteroidia bacterium]|nr:S8 family serine peptidase [Bacteroidia bacterium]